jgi:hypothetical protein
MFTERDRENILNRNRELVEENEKLNLQIKNLMENGKKMLQDRIKYMTNNNQNENNTKDNLNKSLAHWKEDYDKKNNEYIDLLKNFENLKKEYNIVKYQESEIKVLKYLPIEDKLDLIEVTLQKAREDRLYNPMKVDMFFHLNIIYLYTNITFTEKQREDEYKLYDILQTNGIIDQVINAMNENEYNLLLTKINEKMSDELTYNTTTAAVISKFIDDLPANAEAAKKIVDNFDQTKYKAVIDFAQAANGGRTLTDIK